jgi:hypothetical protein
VCTRKMSTKGPLMTEDEWKYLFARADDGDPDANRTFQRAFNELMRTLNASPGNRVDEFLIVLRLMEKYVPEFRRTIRQRVRHHSKKILATMYEVATASSSNPTLRREARATLKAHCLDADTMEDPATLTNDDAIAMLDAGAAIRNGRRS